MIKHYVILSAGDLPRLQGKVQEAIACGWLPKGGVTSFSAGFVGQAMVNRSTAPETPPLTRKGLVDKPPAGEPKDPAEVPHVITYGSHLSSSLIGPFPSYDEAEQYAEYHLEDVESSIVPLEAPTAKGNERHSV